MKLISSCASSTAITAFGSAAPANTGAFQGKPFYVDATTGRMWALTGSSFIEVDLGSFTPPEPGNGLLDDLIAQMTAHEVWPVLADPELGLPNSFKNRPVRIAEQTVGAANYSMLGSTNMPSWFNPSNKAALSTIYWQRVDPWWVVLAQRHSRTGTNAPLDYNVDAGVKVWGGEFLVWRGGNNWEGPLGGAGEPWAFSCNTTDFDQASGASLRSEGSGPSRTWFCRPNNAGAGSHRGVHGGSQGVSALSSPSTIKGFAYRVWVQGVNYNTGAPMDNVKHTVFCSVDPLPYSSCNANTCFGNLNYAPGAGDSAFIQPRATPRYAMFSTLTTAQLEAYPPPGYS